MAQVKDLFPKELKEAKRYKKQKKRLRKVTAKQRLEDNFTDEAIEFVLNIFRDEGPTNLLGVWVKAKEQIGEATYKEYDLGPKITTIIVLLHEANELWRCPLKGTDTAVFGIMGEQLKKAYIADLPECYK